MFNRTDIFPLAMSWGGFTVTAFLENVSSVTTIIAGVASTIYTVRLILKKDAKPSTTEKQ